MKYLIIIESTQTGFSAYSPDLDGCVATGRTREEVERRMSGAIRLHLEGMREDGDKIPVPRTQSAYVEVSTPGLPSLPNVTFVTQTGPYRLLLRFDDGAEGEIDIQKMTTFEGVFEPLKNPVFFSQVRVDPEAGTIVWPNGADLDPLVLHSRITGKQIRFDAPSPREG